MTGSIDTFIKNVKTLLAKNKWSNRELSKKSGVSDRLIGMYLNNESEPSMGKAEKIANAFGFQLWQMQMPDFSPDIRTKGGLERICYAYIKSDKEGRQVMESTAEFIVKHKEHPANNTAGNGKKESAA
jgi:transcriptional regulator with XRE-family HTH domain